MNTNRCPCCDDVSIVSIRSAAGFSHSYNLSNTRYDENLFLKHNLNAAAIGGLSSEMDQIGADIEELIADMRASIAEADRFLETLPE